MKYRKDAQNEVLGVVEVNGRTAQDIAENVTRVKNNYLSLAAEVVFGSSRQNEFEDFAKKQEEISRN